MKRTHRAVLAAVFIAIIAACGILILDKIVRRLRLDLTEHKSFTLSKGTRNILAALNQPVSLKLYYAKIAAMKGPEGIRYYNNYYHYVRSLLEEYEARAKGKLTFDDIDPRPFTDDEEEAVAHGVKRFPLSEDESFFFGLVVKTELGKEKVIPFFEPNRQEFVEYDISKLVVSVTRRDKKKIGVLSSLPVMGPADMSPYMMQMMQMQGKAPEKPWTITTHLEDQYELEAVKTDADDIADDIDFLMVVHPKELSDKTLFAIDQFVMKGGKLLVFVDPHCISDRPPQQPGNPYGAMGHKTASDLNRLLSHWGVEMEEEVMAADPSLAIKGAVRRDARPTPILTYLALNDNEKCFNPQEVVAADLHDVKVVFAGVLKETGDAGTTVAPLMQTTDAAGTWKPAGPFELMMLDPEAIRRGFVEGSERQMLACRITGKLTTNFPEGIAADDKDDAGEDDESDDEEEAPASQPSDAGEEEKEEEVEQKPKVVMEASPDAMVVVVADVDMISDMIAYQDSFFGTSQVGDNASLVFNALDFLSGSGDLIAVRSRGRFSRPFDVVNDIEDEAEKATAVEVQAINDKISDYREKLRKLGDAGEEQDAKLVQSKALAERNKIQDEIRTAQKDLNRLEAGKRENIEKLGTKLRTLNMVVAPAVVLLIAVVLAGARYIVAKSYAARRMP